MKLTSIILFCLFVIPSFIYGNTQSGKTGKDSLVIKIRELDKYLSTDEFIPKWNTLRTLIDSDGENDKEYFLLYKQKNTHYYYLGILDSVKKYTPVVMDLCMKAGEMNEYYYQWSMLADTYMMNGNTNRALEEGERINSRALEERNKTGISYGAYTIATAYLSLKDYSNAEQYYEMALPFFKEMKRWGMYVTIAGNYINALIPQNKTEKAIKTFYTLDSLVFLSENSEESFFVPDITVIVRGLLASTVFGKTGDTSKMLYYIKETERLYKKYPYVSRLHLYNAKRNYAVVTKNYAGEIAYIDSAIVLTAGINDKINLFRLYRNRAMASEKLADYREAFTFLNRYIELKDSVNTGEADAKLQKLSVDFNFKKLELEKKEKELEAEKLKIRFYGSITVALLIILIICILFWRKTAVYNNKLRNQALQLISANEIKKAFLQNINHEIRTPLNAIIGFSGILAASDNLGTEEKQAMSHSISENNKALLKIIEDILFVSNLEGNIEETSRNTIEMNDLCRRITEEIRASLYEGVELAFNPGKTCYVYASETELRQALFNLLHNAAKFTEKGEIKLTLFYDDIAGEIQLSIEDTGCGIPEPDVHKIFEQFYKTNEFSAGAGLGLTICRIVAGRYGGKIRLDTTYTHGARFIFTLPAA